MPQVPRVRIIKNNWWGNPNTSFLIRQLYVRCIFLVLQGNVWNCLKRWMELIYSKYRGSCHTQAALKQNVSWLNL